VDALQARSHPLRHGVARRQQGNVDDAPGDLSWMRTGWSCWGQRPNPKLARRVRCLTAASAAVCWPPFPPRRVLLPLVCVRVVSVCCVLCSVVVSPAAAAAAAAVGAAASVRRSGANQSTGPQQRLPDLWRPLFFSNRLARKTFCRTGEDRTGQDRTGQDRTGRGARAAGTGEPQANEDNTQRQKAMVSAVGCRPLCLSRSRSVRCCAAVPFLHPPFPCPSQLRAPPSG
jgi:hypothetical protein